MLNSILSLQKFKIDTSHGKNSEKSMCSYCFCSTFSFMHCLGK